MKLLLDTHIWIWAERGSADLGSRTAALLADPRHELWLSPISVWEIILLAEKGRITLDRATDDWIAAYGGKPRYRSADFTLDVARAARHIQLSHPDPADRLLAATARHFELTLVTADRRLLDGTGYERLANY